MLFIFTSHMYSSTFSVRAKQPFGAILVIGGCGVLGHHLVSQLLEVESTTQASILDLHTDRNRLPSV